MLELQALQSGYGPVKVLHDLSLRIGPGEVHALLGRNGAGKTTALKTIMGFLKPTAGQVRLNGTVLSDLPAHEVPKHGIGYVPQGRRLFPDLSVDETLSVGLMTRGKGHETRAHVLSLFPRLADRLTQRAGTLSGGEQQMLAMARALCLEPSVLLLDEPTEGLQPSMIELVGETITTLRAADVAVLLVEQRIETVMARADTVTFLENGHGRETVPAQGLSREDPKVRQYLGV